MKDLESEKFLLSCILRGGRNTLIEVKDIIQGNMGCFTSSDHHSIYWAILSAEEEEVETYDLPVLKSVAKSGNIEFTSEQCDYVIELAENPVEKKNARTYAKKIRRLQVARELKKTLYRSIKDLENVTGNETLTEIMSKVETPILDFSKNIQRGSYEPKLLHEAALEYLKHKSENPVESPGLSSGYPLYDHSIGGGDRPGSVNMIVARMKSFKSGHAINKAANVAANGIPVLYLDTEMDDIEQVPRILGSLTGEKLFDIERGNFSKNEKMKKKIFSGYKKLKGMNLWHSSVCGMPYEEMLSLVRRWVHRNVGVDGSGKIKQPAMVIYDYLKIMNEKSIHKISEHQQLGYMTMNLHNLAKHYGFNVSAYAQMNREGISEETTNVIGGSDRIAMYVSNVSLWKKKTSVDYATESEKGITDSGNFKMIPIVCRHGGGLDEGDYINYHVEGDCFRITEGSLFSQLISKVNPATTKTKEGDKAAF